MSAREPARLQRRRISGRRAHGPTDGTAGSAAVVDRCEAAFASPFCTVVYSVRFAHSSTAVLYSQLYVWGGSYSTKRIPTTEEHHLSESNHLLNDGDQCSVTPAALCPSCRSGAILVRSLLSAMVYSCTVSGSSHSETKSCRTSMVVCHIAIAG